MIIKKNSVIFEIENLLIIVLISCFISAKIKLFLTSYFVCYLFILFHELSHIIVATFFGKKILKIRLTIAGVCVTFDKFKLSKIKQFFVYVAGPLSNFFLAVMFRNVDIVFEVNLFLGLLNMMPVYPLDGFNIMSLFLKNRVLYTIERVFLVILFILSMLTFFLTKNPSLLIFAIYINVIKFVVKSNFHSKI